MIWVGVAGFVFFVLGIVGMARKGYAMEVRIDRLERQVGRLQTMVNDLNRQLDEDKARG